MKFLSRFIFCAVATFLFSAAAIANEPVKLTDSQLDTVSAGYVNFDIQAFAAATGLDPTSVTFTESNVVVGEPRRDGYVYTVTTGYAEAFAQGDEVFTNVFYVLDTDEEIVRSKVRYREKTRTVRGKGSKNGGRYRDGPKHHKSQIRETKRLRVRIVTRQPVVDR